MFHLTIVAINTLSKRFYVDGIKIKIKLKFLKSYQNFINLYLPKVTM